MPLVLGGLAIAFIALALLTLITIYWVLTKWHDFARQIPVIGQGLVTIGDFVRDRNAEIIHSVVGVAHAVISWSIDRVHDGFKLLHDLYNATILATVGQLVAQVASINAWVKGIATPQLAKLLFDVTGINAFVHGFVQANIDALNFWRTTLTHTVDTFIIPQINFLINRLDYVTGLQIPTIQARLGVAERTIQQTLPAEIAEAKTDIGAVQRELARTTTAPGTGLLDRVKGIEGTIGQVLPWALAIGLSLPIARNLARVGRNPCTCLEEDGQTDMLPLLLYLFEEAG